jgi:hypothetical protein
VIAAGLGLAACVGPYDDEGYRHSQHQYRSGPSYDTEYDQRRRGDYEQNPYAAPDQRRWNQSWWRNRHDD